MKPQKMTMSPEAVKAALVKNRVAQVAIARALNVTQQHVNKVIENQTISDRVRRAVAQAADINIWEIWPCYLPGSGGPRKPGRPVSKEFKNHSISSLSIER